MMIEALVIVLNAQATKIGYIVGSQVWAEDPEIAWIDGEILEVKDEELKVKTTSDKTVSSGIYFNPFFYDLVRLQKL